MKAKSSNAGLSTSATDVTPVSARHVAGRIVIELSDGRPVEFPVASVPRFRGATPKQLGTIECSPFGLHWPELDEDLSLRGILAGRFAGPHGGARPGAGRPVSGRIPYSTRLPEELVLALKEEAERTGSYECDVVEGLLTQALAGLPDSEVRKARWKRSAFQ